MKNRKIVVVALMLAAVLCVGVGYAALQASLTFTGNVTYTSEFPVVFTNVIGGTAAAKVSDATVDGDGNLTVTIDADEMDPTTNNTLSFTAQIKNNSKYTATSVAVGSFVDSDDFDVTATVDSTEIVAGGQATVTITITMNDYPIPTGGESVATQSVTFAVTAEQG